MGTNIDLVVLRRFIEHESEVASEMYFLSDGLNNDIDKAYYDGYGMALISIRNFLEKLEDATED